jgi:hypothetical protein
VLPPPVEEVKLEVSVLCDEEGRDLVEEDHHHNNEGFYFEDDYEGVPE